MRACKIPFLFFCTLIWLTACSTDSGLLEFEEGQPEPISNDDTSPEDDDSAETNLFLADANADRSVVLLYQRLQEISTKGIAFGHQDGTAYGYNWQEHLGFPSDSDVLRVIGDYPAVLGFDLGNIESGDSRNIDSVSFDLMRLLIQEAHAEGSIVTLSWHVDNPITGNLPWDTTPAVAQILPGGDQHQKFVAYMDVLASFFTSLVDEQGNPVPVVFRPWHEMNGSWFWWGDTGAHTTEDYKALFRQTVTQLTERGVHNLLYCYSPDTALTLDEYLEFYPGDEWVDIYGADIYDFLNNGYNFNVQTGLEVIQQLGEERSKLYAFTETGLENVVQDNWWTNTLYPAIKNSGVSYVLVWRNDKKVHHFGPFENHPSADDFRQFADFEDILLRKDVNLGNATN